MGWISRKAIAWQLPKVWKELTGKEMKVDPDTYDRMIDAIPDAIDKEFGLKINKGWWDRFVDSLNRLPRPLFALGSLVLLVIGAVAPDTFASIMVSWGQAPTMVWVVIITVITGFFGGRIITGLIENSGGISKLLEGMKPKQLAERILAAEAEKKRIIQPKEESEEEFLRRVRDAKNPLSEDDIIRWNAINDRQKEETN